MDWLGVAQLGQTDNSLKNVGEATQMVGAAVTGGVGDGIGKEGPRIVGGEVQSAHVDGELLAANLAREPQRAFAELGGELPVAVADSDHQLDGRRVVAPGNVQAVGVLSGDQ